MILTALEATTTAVEEGVLVQFTLGQLVTIILGICGGIVTISAAITVLIKTVQKLKEPEKEQNTRLDTLEKKVKKFEQFFDSDNKRLIELERGNTVTQQAILALLSHALNGNDEDSLKSAKSNLEQYLLNKGGTEILKATQ